MKFLALVISYNMFKFYFMNNKDKMYDVFLTFAVNFNLYLLNIFNKFLKICDIFQLSNDGNQFSFSIT